MNASKRNNALRFTTGVIMLASCAVVLTSMLFSHNVSKLMKSWSDNVQLSIFLLPEATAGEISDIEQLLKSDSRIESVEVISQEKALSEFRGQLAMYTADISKDTELLKLIPKSIEARLSESVEADQKISSLESISSKVKNLAGVDEVSFGEDWIQKYSAVLAAIKWSSIILGLIISTTCIFVVSNSIGSLILTRRDEIEILEMIGATKSMIRRPFVVEGAITGFISSLTALLLVWGSFTSIQNMLLANKSFLDIGTHLSFIPVSSLFLFVIFFTFAGAVGSWICVARINDGWAASSQ